MATITGIKAGTTTITASYGGKTATVQITVQPIDPSLTFSVNSTALTYNGAAQLLGTVSYNGDGQAKYYVSTSNSAPGASASGWVNCSNGTQVKATNAGTYYVFLQATAGTNYNAVAVKAGNTTGKAIAQKAVTYKADNQSWVYDGSSHSASNTATKTAGDLVSGHTATFSCSGSVGPNVTSSSGTKTLSSVTIRDASNNTVTSNYAITKQNGTLNITARPITVTASSASRAYNGSPLTSNSATAEVTGTNRGLVSGHSMTSCTVTGTITNVGSVDNVASAAVIKSGSTDVTSNYSITYVKGTLTITQRTVTIYAPEFNSDTLTYNGEEQLILLEGTATTGGTMYSYVSTSNSTPTFSTSTWSTGPVFKTDAGTYYAWYYCYVSDTTNNTGSGINTVTKISSPASKVINQKEVGLSWGTSSWTYDGSTHSTTCSATGVISGDTCTVTLSGNSVGKNVGSATVTASSLSNSNYKLPSSKTKSISITAKVATLTWGTLTWVYDNNTHSTTCSVSNLVSGDSCTVTLSGNSVGKNVGTATVTATELSNTNYTLTGASNTSKTLSVTAAAVTVPTPSNGGGVYNKTAYTATFPSVTGASITKYRWSTNGSSSWTETTTNPSQTNAGTIYVQAQYTADSNHSIGGTTGGSAWSSNATLAVTQKEVTLTWGTASWTYDGNTHSTTCTAGNLVSGDTCTVTLSGNSVGKNVGSATVTATELSNGNYKLPSSKTKSISITARIATLSWGTLSWVYDNNTHSTTCTVSNVVSGDTCTVTLDGNSVGKNVGTATVTATALSNSNYTLTGASNTSKTLSVTAAAVTVPTPTNGGGVYNKTAYNASFSSVTGASITKYRWSTNGSSGWTETTTNPGQTNAGTIYVQAQYTADSNHSIGGTTGGSAWSSNATLAVTQKEVTLSWGTSSWVYDGSAHSTTCTAGSLISGDTCTVTLSGNSVGAAVGSATVTASSLSNSNYKLPSSKTKSISITQREVTLTWGTLSWTYDGSAHSTTCTAGNLVSGDTCTVTLSGNSVGKNVGSATVTATALSNSNYKLPTSGLSKTISITQKEVTLTWGTTTWTYDGSVHSTTCTLGGVVSGDTCTLTLGNNSITYVGSQTVTTSLSNTNYKLPSSNTKTISVTKRTPSITLSSVNKPYDGNKYYSYVTASDAKGTLYWKKGSAPTTSSYGGTVDVTSVGNSLGTSFPTAYVQNNADDCTLYWIFVPSSTLTITSGQTYAANYNDSASGNVTMTITASAITIPTISAVEVTYDKAAHSLTFPAVTGASITSYQTSTNGSTWTDASPLTTNPSLTNVGTIYVRAYYTADGNHSGSGYTTGKTIKINQKAVTLSWGSTTSWVYDGNAHSVSCSIASGVISGDTCTVSVSNNSITYVGSQTATASLSNGNYVISGTSSKTISVTKATPTITVSGVNKTYDNVDYYAYLTSSNVKGTVYWKKNSAPSTSSYDGYKSISSTGNSLNIDLGSVKLDADDHTLYWLVVPSSTANSLSSGHTYAENYNNASGNVEMTINPKSISIGSVTNGGGVYKKANYYATFPSVTGATITNYRYSTDGSTWTNTNNTTAPGQTNVGTLYVQAYYTAQSNYTGSAWSSSATITVTQKEVTLNWGTSSWTYDGSTHSTTCTAGNLESGDTCTVTLSNNSVGKNVGSQTVTASSLSNANYKLPSSKTKSISITAKVVTLSWGTLSWVYDNATHSTTCSVSNLVSGDSCTVTLSGNSVGKNVGTATVTATALSNSNYTLTGASNTSKTLSITAATITYTNTSPVSEYCTATATATNKTLGNVSITIASASATDYSGTAITNSSDPSVEGYTISQSGWSISSDGKTITVPANVTAGTYNITVTAAKPNHTSKTNGITVNITAVTLSNLAMTLGATTIAYGGSTTVTQVKATYNNGKWKDVKGDLTPNVTTGDCIYADPSNIVEITV